MIKNKISILIFSTLITVNAYTDVAIVKDSPEFINISEKIKEVERHLYIISPNAVNELEEIKATKEYLLSFADPSFKNDFDFPSQKNRPEIDITSKKLMTIDNEYKKILKEYEIIDEVEAEIRYEKSVSLMENVFENEEKLSKIQEKIDILEEQILPHLELEENIKNKILQSKNKLNENQLSLIKYADSFISLNNLDGSIKKIDLNRAKKIESSCPKNGFNPKAKNSMASFYYFQVNENLCIYTSLPSLPFKTLSKLMNDKSFIDKYEESLMVLAEENLKIGNWSLRYSYSFRDYKTQMKEIQSITRPAIRKIENKVGYSKSNLNVKKNRLLRAINEEQDLIDLDMEEFDEDAFERKKEAAEFILFDDYIKAIEKYTYSRVKTIYNKDHRQFDYMEYETIEIDEIDAPVVLVVDYLGDNVEIFYVNQNLTYKYRFDASYGWGTLSAVKLEKKHALIHSTIPVGNNMILKIIDETFENIVIKYNKIVK